MEWKKYRRTNVAEMMPYSSEAVKGMSEISVSQADQDSSIHRAGPLPGNSPELYWGKG